jgi:mRNA-degrading endonuclease toxin of MazEF toxin-antitoxin module
MTPKVGEVYMLDLGYEGKVRPVVIMSREDAKAPRALALFVPLTKESRQARPVLTRGDFKDQRCDPFRV